MRDTPTTRSIAILVAIVVALYGLFVVVNAGPQDTTVVIDLGYVGLCAAATAGGWMAWTGRMALAVTAIALSIALVPILLLGQVACCLD